MITAIETTRDSLAQPNDQVYLKYVLIYDSQISHNNCLIAVYRIITISLQ